jgi:D-serine deaminase-like pyridoxal phosphate-dependent protein
VTADALKAEIARCYGTPAVVIDLDIVERNIARAQSLCDRAGLANRPHIKTHKSPTIAALQRDAGARGLSCQKLGEAEVMAAAGLDDLLICYNLLGEQKIGRLGRLLGSAKVTVSADNPTVVAGLAPAAAQAGRSLPVVVECDTGRQRAGVTTAAEAVTLARLIAATSGLTFAGLLLYPSDNGMAAAQAFLDTVKAGLAAEGLPPPAIVSTGGTPNLAHLGEIHGASEHRAGTYVFNDRMMMAAGAATLADCALTVLTTVVSRAAPDRGILDAGSKALTSDKGNCDGYGVVVEYPDVRVPALAEEHGFLDLGASAARPTVGELVRVVPNHVCVVVNMTDRAVAVRGGKIVGDLPIAARGKTG